MLIKPGTFSKDQAAWGLPPDLRVVDASGQYLKLSNGRWYLDWVSGLGTNLLGYDDPLLSGALAKMPLCAPSLPYDIEYEAAERLAWVLKANVPGWQTSDLGVRFCKTGSEASSMAVRLARAVTGRDGVICFSGHYHGWGSWTVGRTSPAKGVIKDFNVMDIEWGNPDPLGQISGLDVAALIFEHPAIDATTEWYDCMRRWCYDYGVVLIADEVVTGLRYGLGGACGKYGIIPDLVCMGKSMGNGASIAAVVGHLGLMKHFAGDSPVFCSSTTWGSVKDLAAANCVLSIWDKECVEYIDGIGDILMTGLQGVGWDVFGHGARSVMRFDSVEQRAFFIQGMFERGILMNRPQFPSLSHTTDDVVQTITAARKVKAELDTLNLAKFKKRVKGKLPQVLFKER